MNNGRTHILTRAIEAANGNLIQTTFLHLRAGQTSSRNLEKTEFVTKKDEISSLTSFADKNDCWYNDIKTENYIGEGAEQKVYLTDDGRFVIKINDTVFYDSWQSYFINLLIHNILFPSTAYRLLGFFQQNDDFYAVVRQPFIASTQPTDLDSLCDF